MAASPLSSAGGLDEAALDRLLELELGLLSDGSLADSDEEEREEEVEMAEEDAASEGRQDGDGLGQAWSMLRECAAEQQEALDAFETSFQQLRVVADGAIIVSGESQSALRVVDEVSVVLRSIVEQVEREAERDDPPRQPLGDNSEGSEKEGEHHEQPLEAAASRPPEKAEPAARGEEESFASPPPSAAPAGGPTVAREAKGTLRDGETRRETGKEEEEEEVVEVVKVKGEEEEEAIDPFVLELAREMEARQNERKLLLASIEEERIAALERLQAEWSRSDAAVRIQKIVRSFLCKCNRRRRSSAVARIQSAMKHVANRLRGLKLRKLAKKQAEQRANERGMAEEDRRAREIRDWETANWRGMVSEDLLAHQVRKAEKRRARIERAGMEAEDAAASICREKERAERRREEARLEAERQVLAAERAAQARARDGLAREDAAARAERQSRAGAWLAAQEGPLVQLANGGFDLFEDVPFHGQAPRRLAAQRNRFARFKQVLPRDCPTEHLLDVALQDNLLRSISGLEACAQVQVLDLSGNRLTQAALEPLAALRALQVLNLRGNPLGSFHGRHLVAPRLNLLDLSSCQLSALPSALELPALRSLRLGDNNISGASLQDQTCSLPALEELSLPGNALRRVTGRSAHVMPRLCKLDLSSNPLDGDLAAAFGEHINLEYLSLPSGLINKREARELARYLKKLREVNQDALFLYRAFEGELTEFQAAVRGAIKREHVRVALERNYVEELDGEELAGVDVDEFTPDFSDEEADPISPVPPRPQPSPHSSDSHSDAHRAQVRHGGHGHAEERHAAPEEDDGGFGAAVARLRAIGGAPSLPVQAVALADEADQEYAAAVARLRKITADAYHGDNNGGPSEALPQVEAPPRESSAAGASTGLASARSAFGGPAAPSPASTAGSRTARVEEVRADWGFKDPHTAEGFVKRRNKTLKGKLDNERRQALADPVKRYRHLMRKVRREPHPPGVQAHGIAPGSQVLKDRHRHMLKRNTGPAPAWARGPAGGG